MTTTPFISRKGMTRRSMLGAALAAVPLAAVAGPAWADPAAPAVTRLMLPVPTGPHPVGTVQLHLVDRSRPDDIAGPGHFRELMATVWYPARDVQRYPVAPWMPAGALQAFLDDAGFSALAPPWRRSLPATWALRCGNRADGCPSSCSRTARTATRATTPSWSKSSPATDTRL
ncbi:hypothetical protein ABZS98_37595 [Streptomyces avermitilis]|uniref:hypothetical protein n=1 Tax=Streptomyces avermitilis TaxID=33903 RepID=UPI0033BD23AD